MDLDRFNYLLDRIGHKDKAAFEEIYDEYKKKIKWTIFNIINDWFYVEDVLNEIFLKIWYKAHRLKISESPDAWVYSISKNTALDFYKVHIKKHKRCIEFEEVSYKESKLLGYIQNYHNFEMESLIQSLDEKDREIIILRIVYDFTHKEISELMKLPLGTVLWRYQRILLNIEGEILEECFDLTNKNYTLRRL